MINPKLRDSFKDFNEGQAKQVRKISGMLGIPIDGEKKVEVPGRPGFVYVRLRNSQNEVILAFNEKVSPVYDLPVEVVRRGNYYYVDGRDIERYQNWGSNSSFVPQHASQHMFNPDFPGGDIVWVYSNQFMPLLGMPSGTLSGRNVMVSEYPYRKSDGTWGMFGATGTADIVQHKPKDSQAVMGLVYGDRTTGNLGVFINSGTPFAASLTGTSQVLQYIPQLTNPEYLPIAAVRLVSGTNSLDWDNLYDMRPFFTPVPTGTAGGGGVWGSILGTLSDQTDLQAALDEKLSETFPDGNRILFTDASGTVGTSSIFQYDQDTNSLLQGASSLIFSGAEMNSFELVGSSGSAGAVIASYGSGTNAFLAFLKGNGTFSSPTHIVNNDVLGLIRARGYNGDGDGYMTTSRGYIQFVADGDWTTSSTPLRIETYVTASGTTNPFLATVIKSNGDADLNNHNLVNVANMNSGTWTPTGTTGTKVSSMTTFEMNYIRIGNQVMFNGLLVVKTTSTGSFTCYLSLPIASNFTAFADASGNGTQPGAGGGPNIISIREDQTNNRLQLDGYTYTSGENVYYRLVGGYIIK